MRVCGVFMHVCMQYTVVLYVFERWVAVCTFSCVRVSARERNVKEKLRSLQSKPNHRKQRLPKPPTAEKKKLH